MWLQEDHKYDIKAEIYSSGNNFLHRIAKSPNVARFIENLTSHLNDSPKLDVLRYDARGKTIANAVNSDGEMWLEILVTRGDDRALDLALSPHRKFSWELCNFRDIIKRPIHCAQQKGNQTTRLILSSFELRWKMKELYNSICQSYNETEEQLFQRDGLSPLCGPDATLNGKRFVRFFRDWEEDANLDYDVFGRVVKNGFSRAFEIFYSVNEAWFLTHEYHITLNDDNDQYIQPEISSEDESETILGDLVTACIVGKSESWFRHGLGEKHRYFRDVL